MNEGTPTVERAERMRLPRLRFTVRRIMIIVAIAAVVLGANDARLRLVRYQALRSTHDWRGRACSTSAELHASVAADNEREAARLRAAISSDHEAARQQVEVTMQIVSNIESQAAVERAAEQKFRARARFHDALRIKYERAARYPWVSVAPDPPEPE